VIAIVCLAPVMIGTIIAIKLDSKGPVIFRQKRYGFNNEIIEVLKFRSMYTDMADPDAKKVVTRGDPG
jgi:lipopolysaccharide/colanic/teichoic acid biosynthesis glycosyltransferase